MVGTGGEVRGEVRVRTIGSRDTSSGSDGVCYKERPGLTERSVGVTGMRWKWVEVGGWVVVVGDMTGWQVCG